MIDFRNAVLPIFLSLMPAKGAYRRNKVVMKVLLSIKPEYAFFEYLANKDVGHAIKIKNTLMYDKPKDDFNVARLSHLPICVNL